MERPDATTMAYFAAAVPEDPRARRGAMFGHPCAFVNGNMFFGTFAQRVIVRVGGERAAALATGAVRIFEPRPGRAWKEYVQVGVGAVPAARLAALAAEALAWTASLPPKPATKGALAGRKPIAPLPRPAAAKPKPAKAVKAKPKPAKAVKAKPKPAKAVKAKPVKPKLAKVRPAQPKLPAKKRPAKKAAR